MQIVNFGCGPFADPGCINIDGSLTALIARIPLPAGLFAGKKRYIEGFRRGQVVYCRGSKLNFPANSLDGFYCSHVLEHIERSEVIQMLPRIKRWLKPGAWIRIVLPDLRKLAESYVRRDANADEFVKLTHLSTGGMSTTQWKFGHSYHRWMYDADSFSEILSAAGFTEVTQREFGKSADPHLAELDLPERAEGSLYLEGR